MDRRPRSTQDRQGLRVLLYPGTIDLSTTHLRYVATVVRVHRRRIGSRWRRLSAGRQALLVLAHLRNGDPYARLAAGFGIGIATVYRYIRETVHLLAARAPTLTDALRRLSRHGDNYAILDGSVIRTDRLAADRPFYSGKHRHHGINLQVSRVKNLAQFSWMKVVLVDLAGGSRSVVACRVPRGGGCG